MAECCCAKRTTDRSEEEIKDLLNRLARIEGQIRGIRNMVEEGAYCPDIMIQVSAASSALDSLNKVLLTNHLHTCVLRDIEAGKEDAVEELAGLLGKLMH